MSASSFVEAERAGIADDLARLGPDRPTLCAGWSTFDLAVHLVVREHEPLAAAGIVLPGPFARHLESRMEARRRDGYGAVVDRFRAGPGPVFRVMGPWANVSEYFIHHEDIRRANDEAPRVLERRDEELLWRVVGFSVLLAKAKVRFPFTVDAPGFGTRVVRDGEPKVLMTGRPGEIALYLAGRKDAAQVEITGPDDGIARLGEVSFGI